MKTFSFSRGTFSAQRLHFSVYNFITEVICWPIQRNRNKWYDDSAFISTVGTVNVGLVQFYWAPKGKEASSLFQTDQVNFAMIGNCITNFDASTDTWNEHVNYFSAIPGVGKWINVACDTDAYVVNLAFIQGKIGMYFSKLWRLFIQVQECNRSICYGSVWMGDGNFIQESVRGMTYSRLETPV